VAAGRACNGGKAELNPSRLNHVVVRFLLSITPDRTSRLVASGVRWQLVFHELRRFALVARHEIRTDFTAVTSAPAAPADATHFDALRGRVRGGREMSRARR